MKRILTSLIVIASVAALSAGAAFANDHGGYNPGDSTTVTVDPSATDNSATIPTNSSSVSTGSNTSTQTVGLSQTTAALSRVFVQITGGAGAAGAPSGAATQTNSSGGNTANPADEVEHAGNNAGDNSAGGKVVSVGGDGGNGGPAAGVVTVAPVTISGNASSITQLSKQKIVVIAPAIQKVSSDFNAFTLKLLGFGLGPA